MEHLNSDGGHLEPISQIIERAGGAEAFIQNFFGPSRRRKWGNWIYLKRDGVLVYRRDGRTYYEVNVEDMGNSARACLDWIFQVAGKTWCTAEDCGNFLAAIRDLVNPQAHLCGGCIGLGRR
jgi:hypothetical protein